MVNKNFINIFYALNILFDIDLNTIYNSRIHTQFKTNLKRNKYYYALKSILTSNSI